MKSLFGGSAIAAAALLSALPLVAARPSVAETAVQPQQSLQQPTTAKTQIPGDSAGKVLPETPAGKTVEPLLAETAVLPPGILPLTASEAVPPVVSWLAKASLRLIREFSRSGHEFTFRQGPGAVSIS